eukprot:357536-Chlamydomonas_euryale.AAC.2
MPHYTAIPALNRTSHPRPKISAATRCEPHSAAPRRISCRRRCLKVAPPTVYLKRGTRNMPRGVRAFAVLELSLCTRCRPLCHLVTHYRVPPGSQGGRAGVDVTKGRAHRGEGAAAKEGGRQQREGRQVEEAVGWTQHSVLLAAQSGGHRGRAYHGEKAVGDAAHGAARQLCERAAAQALERRVRQARHTEHAMRAASGRGARHRRAAHAYYAHCILEAHAARKHERRVLAEAEPRGGDRA